MAYGRKIPKSEMLRRIGVVARSVLREYQIERQWLELRRDQGPKPTPPPPRLTIVSSREDD